MNRKIGIPAHVEALKAADIPAIAKGACREADLNYPVPKYLSPRHVEALLSAMLAPVPRTRRR